MKAISIREAQGQLGEERVLLQLGDDHLHHLGLCLLSQPEMKLWSGNGLLLHQQSGADFDFAADTKRIDTLIAYGLHCVRPNCLPVIIFRSLIDALYGFAGWGEAHQIEPSFSRQIRGAKDQRRNDQLLQ